MKLKKNHGINAVQRIMEKKSSILIDDLEIRYFKQHGEDYICLTDMAKQSSGRPDLKGNLRDHATTEQLLVLANLESINAHLIRDGLAQDERLEKLNEIAIYLMELLAGTKTMLALRQP